MCGHFTCSYELKPRSQPAGHQEEESPRATLPRPQGQASSCRLPTRGGGRGCVCVWGGDCLLRQRTKCGHQSRFQRGLKEGIGQDPPQCPHSCQGIISGRMTQKVPDIEKVSGTNPPLVPNGISFPLLPSSTPIPPLLHFTVFKALIYSPKFSCFSLCCLLLSCLPP